METEENREELNEWEQIEPPYSAAGVTAQWNHNVEPAVINDNFFSDSSVFPPTNHEGLPLTPAENQRRQESPPLSLSDEDGRDGERPAGDGSGIRERLGVLSSEIVRVAYRVRENAVGRVGYWSIAAATTGAAAAVLVSWWCVKLRRRRMRMVREDVVERLMILLRERDQKIKQLVLQIAGMNEVLSERRRIPVIQVG